jgi:hypothetical protein
MKFQQPGPWSSFLIMFPILFALAGSAWAQAPSGTLRGQVTDPSGAAVAGASVTVTSSAATTVTLKTGRDGSYEAKGLEPDTYTVLVTADGFANFENDNVAITANQIQKLDVALTLAAQKQEVTVSGSPEGGAVDVNPNNNAGALILKGKDLDALSDDPDELQSELQALAGPSAGPNGGQIYIDGFTGGQLPPKSSIREIRINQNPFSAEFDKLGYGRIEIFTKPGTDKYHGQLMVDGNDSAFNSRNPFAPAEPGYYTTFISGNLSGPINKKTSFFLDVERRDINNVSVVSAETLDSNFNPIAFSAAVPNPSTRTNISPRLDWQVTPSNTLTARYRYVNSSAQNAGVGQFSLESQGYNTSSTEQVAQLVDNQIINAKMVNETRFQYTHDSSSQTAQNTSATINVNGAFTGGGSNQGNSLDSEDTYELQNYTSIATGNHSIKFGARVRIYRDVSSASAGFNGAFTFNSLTAYQITEQGLANGLTYSQIAAMGGGASQFSITAGVPQQTVTQFDLEPYFQDDWRLRPNMTLSLGLRYETQDNIHDHADFAPRIGFAWGLGGGKTKAPKTVLRFGSGLFYDRFTETYVLNAERFNGVNQEQYFVTNPDFYPTIPPVSSLSSSATFPTRYQIDPHLHAPYTWQTAVSVERQLTKSANVAMTYINSYGEDALVSQNINAPLPGTYDPSDPTSGVRPFGNVGNIYNYESAGKFRQNQLIANFNVRMGTKLSMFGFYALNYAKSDTAGASSFPSNPYDLAADYGRAAFDTRNRLFLGGTWSLPYGFRLSPFLVANSGAPFNITIGKDLNGDSIFNDRPAFATAATLPQNLVQTRYGNFDIAPVTGETLVPVNYGTGPNSFTMNLRVSKTIGLGKKADSANPNGRGSRPSGMMIPPSGGGGGGRGGGPGGGPFGMGDSSGRKYSLTFAVSARNLFNNVNLGPPIGTVTSPLFGRSNSIGGLFGGGGGGGGAYTAANRRIDLVMTFSF